MSMLKKVEGLEKTLSLFRAEVETKLKIMHRILITRNEQVTVLKKLLAHEQSLCDSLLEEWTKSPTAATTGILLNLPQLNLELDEQNCMTQSHVECFENERLGPGPAAKKSKSSLRKKRKSSRTFSQGRSGSHTDAYPEDDDPLSTCGNDWDKDDAEGTIQPLVSANMTIEDDTDLSRGPNPNASNEFGSADTSQVEYIMNTRGSKLLLYQGFVFRKTDQRGRKTYWKCVKSDNRTVCCKARCTTTTDDQITMSGVHNHFSDPANIEKRREKCELLEKAWSLQNYYAGLKSLNESQSQLQGSAQQSSGFTEAGLGIGKHNISGATASQSSIPS